MNFELEHIPKRTTQPREAGVTMVMDKGLSLREAEDLITASGHLVDLIKLGFGTSLISNNIPEKIKLYQEAGVKVYLGGTLFEAFLIRGQYEDYKRLLNKWKLDTAEVSDGSIELKHISKCDLISDLAKDFRVLSEVGSKEAGIIIHPSKWKNMMKAELQAGSWKVIAEARESGNVGIYRPNGSAHVSLISKILDVIPADSILWEAPQKAQQVWFINQLGHNVNLGNIAPNEVIPLETLRLGVRGDTFFNFLPQGIDVNKVIAKSKKKQK
jgi:phosphosulfolactate synthase